MESSSPPSSRQALGGTSLNEFYTSSPKREAGLEGSSPRLTSYTSPSINSDPLIRKPNEFKNYDDHGKRLMLVPNPPFDDPSPLYESEFPHTAALFIDSYTKVRSMSAELCQYASDTLARGYSTEPAKIEYISLELLKLARQLNNPGDDEERKRQDNKVLPPPLVRPRRIRRKQSDEEDPEDGDKKRKLGTTSELYCHSCGTIDTPEWRRGPDGCKSLCNACGLHYAKILRRETMIPNRQPGVRTSMTLKNLLN